jgi:hypothetical protein
MILCDTCGKEVPAVARVVIDTGYDRSLSKPLYNCPDCFQKKEQQRTQAQGQMTNAEARN